MKNLFVFLLTILLMGCASSPPKNKSNACDILYEKEGWFVPLSKAARKWGIPKHTILSIIFHESKFVSNAKPPRRGFLGLRFLGRRISSAYGYPQALDGTWEDYKRSTGNDSAKRTDFNDSVDFIGWYLNRSVKELKISARNAYDLYLAYHQGNAAFKKKSYLQKPRIRNYARRVQRTAVQYRQQLRSC